jgi:hypothetical protein
MVTRLNGAQARLFVKTKDQINIDYHWEVEEFTFVRSYPKGKVIFKDKIECSIQSIQYKG